MKLNLTFFQKFLVLLLSFTTVTAAVLWKLVSAKNEPIDFASQEMRGNSYQRSLESTLKFVMEHGIAAQDSLMSGGTPESSMASLQKAVDGAFEELAKVDSDIGPDLQFTEAGLRSRKRDHLRVANVLKEWSDLKANWSTLEVSSSNEKHGHLITDLRGMITHVGDSSNLVLDPDLDSYYLMDITLLALPQIQSRIYNAIVKFAPVVKRGKVSDQEKIEAAVLAALMNESDLEKVKGDFDTVLNEDSNFFGKSEGLQKNVNPSHTEFLSDYGELIAFVSAMASGNVGTEARFKQVSMAALESGFEYSRTAITELDQLLEYRTHSYYSSKVSSLIFCVLGLLVLMVGAGLFVRSLTSKLRGIMSTLDETASQLTTSSNKSAKSAQTLSDASTQQASSLQETMASTEQISAMVSQNAESAGRVKVAVDANQEVSAGGAQSVTEMLQAIREIKENNDEVLRQMESSNKEFSSVVTIITEIGDKTKVINDIVFQTKLLSFNAAVEAARAGEHGKGFAVVAEEVGNLAQMSGNAAKEISDMLNGSVRNVKEIIDRTSQGVERIVEVGKDKISSGLSSAEKCRVALSKISENARSIASMVGEISGSSAEQAKGVQEINKAISLLDQVTQKNSEVAQQSSSQAEQLNTEVERLGTAVGDLKIFLDGQDRPSEPAESASPRRIRPVNEEPQNSTSNWRKSA